MFLPSFKRQHSNAFTSSIPLLLIASTKVVASCSTETGTHLPSKTFLMPLRNGYLCGALLCLELRDELDKAWMPWSWSRNSYQTASVILIVVFNIDSTLCYRQPLKQSSTYSAKEILRETPIWL